MKSKNGSKSTSNARQFRRSLLSVACASALCAPGAFAQTGSFGFVAATPGTATVTGTSYLITTINNQFNSGTPMLATLLNDDFVTLSTGGVGSTFTVIGDTTTASSNANSVFNNGTGSLVLLQNIPPDGITIQSGQVRGNTTPVTNVSSVTGSDTGVTLVNQGPGSVVINNNSIAATTQLNQATSTLSGAVPLGYASGVDGGSAMTYAGATANSTASTSGGVSIGNSQVSLNAGPVSGSSASVASSNVTLSITDSPGNWTSPLTVNGNTISATYGANNAANTISMDAGSAPFTAAAAIGNLQVNREGGGVVPTTASVTGSGVTAAIRDTTGGVTTLTSTLDVSSNTVSAAATGNGATNAIAFGALADVAGTATVPSNVASASAANSLSLSVAADLVISNAQTNQDTGLASVLTGGTVTASADLTVAGSAITASSNTLSASANGNEASSRISTSASSANFTGSAAAANLQTNATNTRPMLDAANTGSSVSIGVGFTNNVVAGALTANDNVVSATATGNGADTTVAIASSNVTLTAPAAPGGSAAAGLVTPQATAAGGASATNVQVNIGSGSIGTTLVNGTVEVNLVDQTAAAANANGVAIVANANKLVSTATGSSATTGVSLSGTEVTGTGAVSSVQVNNNTVAASASGSGVTATGLGIADSTITLSGNTVAATGTAHAATNTLDVTATDVFAGAPALAGSTGSTSLATSSATSSAAFSVSNAQNATGPVSASNVMTANSPFAQIAVGGAGATITGSELTVTGNTASARATQNDAQNELNITSTNLTVPGGTLGKIGAITNLQATGAVASSASLSDGGGTQPAIGVTFEGTLAGGNVTVSANVAEAVALGNTAGNALAITGTNVTDASGAGAIASTATSGSVLAPFALVNTQSDGGTGRTATVSGIYVGIQDRAAAPSITGTDMTVSGNQVLAEVRNNNATNTADALQMANFTAGVSALNQQSSAAAASSTITDARVRLQATGTTITGSDLTQSTNEIKGLAVGNSASTLTTVKTSNTIEAAAVIAAATAGSSINSATGAVTTNADFGVVNSQSMTGNVTSAVEASVRMPLDGSALVGGSATLSDNKASAIAQANSSVGGVILDAPNLTASAAVASYQNGTGVVSATLTTQADISAAAAIRATSATGTPLTVSGNTLSASAGQNESITVLDAQATTLTGRAFSNQFSGYVAPTATASSDYSALNVQTGVGSVTSSVVPGAVGISANSITGGHATVTNNTVSARSTVNYTSNTVNLEAVNGIDATGAVLNVQTSSAGAGVSATAGSALVPTMIGASGLSASPTLNATSLAVTGNALKAEATGNQAFNTLQVSAGSTIAGPGAVGVPTFAVLNSQSNAAGMTALATNATVGMFSATSITATPVSILNNNVLAAGTGNTASNSLTASGVGGSIGSSASMLVSNIQSNTAGISATVSGVSIGVSGGAISGSASVVSNNSITAQAVGNTAVNKVGFK
jgi:hypothetical protein